MNDAAVCPECRQGKHLNCDGTAWNNTTDQPVACDCWKIEHDTWIGAPDERPQGPQG